MGTFSTVEVLGQTIVASTNSTAVGVHHSDRIAVQSEWTDSTGSAKTAVTGVNQVDTLTFAAVAASGAGDYVAITDTNGAKWGVALSKAGIAEVSSITTIAEGSVAEQTRIIAIAEGSVKNVTQVVAAADVSGSLAGDYFKVYDGAATTVGVWFSVDSVPATAPAGALACTRAVEVPISEDDANTVVAAAITTAFALDAALVVANVGATVTMTDVAYAARTAATDGAAPNNTGFAITTTAVGHASSLLGKYFVLKDEVSTVGVYFDVDGANGADPSGQARGLVVELTAGMTAAQVGAATYNAIHGDSKFNGVSGSGTANFVVVSTTYGDKTGQGAGDSGFTVTQEVAGAASALTGKYFLLGDVGGTVGVWFDVGNEGTSAPAGATGATRALEITTVARGDTAAAVAGALRTALDGDSKFDVGTLTDATFTAICKDLKSVANIAAGDSGFTVSTSTQGSDLGAEPTGAIWASIAAAKRVQADISADTTDENVAARVRTALAGITGISAVITVGAASGATIPLTQVARGPVAIPVPKNATDAGAGSIAAASPATTPGVASMFDVTANTITIASHGWSTGLKVAASINSGSLPTGIAATDYWAYAVSTSSIKLYDSYANAIVGGATGLIDFSSQGDGGKIVSLTPAAIGGGVIHLEGSVDGITYFDIASMTANMTTSGSALWHVSAVGYMFVRVNAVVTTGQVYVISKIAQKGCGCK